MLEVKLLYTMTETYLLCEKTCDISVLYSGIIPTTHTVRYSLAILLKTSFRISVLGTDSDQPSVFIYRQKSSLHLESLLPLI